MTKFDLKTFQIKHKVCLTLDLSFLIFECFCCFKSNVSKMIDACILVIQGLEWIYLNIQTSSTIEQIFPNCN